MFASASRPNGGGHQGIVVGGTQANRSVFNRPGADIRRRNNATCDDGAERHTAIGALFHRIGGFQVLLSQTNVEKRRRVFVHTGKHEAVDDLIASDVGIVVDVDLIPDVFPECVIVGSTKRSLARDVVGDDGDRVGVVRASKHVKIRVVGQGVIGDQRRLSVARCPAKARQSQHRRNRCTRSQESAQRRQFSCSDAIFHVKN